MITRVVMHPTAGAFTSVMPAHCSACALGDDGGIIGNAFTCAVDKVDRRPTQECPTPEQFVEITTPLEERYPGYGDEFWKKSGNISGVQNMLLKKASVDPEYMTAVVPGIGVAVFGRLAPKLPDEAFSLTPYETEPKPKDAA
jgi:hypothetical protein